MGNTTRNVQMMMHTIPIHFFISISAESSLRFAMHYYPTIGYTDFKKSLMMAICFEKNITCIFLRHVCTVISIWYSDTSYCRL